LVVFVSLGCFVHGLSFCSAALLAVRD
jgi:hypothetical protein